MGKFGTDPPGKVGIKADISQKPNEGTQLKIAGQFSDRDVVVQTSGKEKDGSKTIFLENKS